MLEIKKIIVPIDFDKHTEKLARFSVEMAKKLDATPLFFHVSESFEGYIGFDHPAMEEIDKELRLHAEQKMKTLLETLGSECSTCSGKVVNGDVVDEITELAKTEKAGLIIIGTHGARGIEKILMGSVAERVVHQAPCPVLLFNPYKPA